MVKQLTFPILLAIALAGCGSSSPSAPSSTTFTVDLNGTWHEENGGSLSMTLQQSGTAVTGTATFNDRNPTFGSYTGIGTLTATVSGTTVTMTEAYRILADDGTDRSNCTENVTSTWTVTAANKMVGPYSQTDVCSGIQVFSKAGTVTIVKQ